MARFPSYEAHLDEFRFGRLSGWAHNADDPGEVVALEVYANETLVGEVLAESHRPDLAGLRNGYVGFSCPVRLPPAITLPAAIEVRIASTGAPVINGRVSLESPYEGYVDPASSGNIEGWVWNILDPKEAVGLALLVDGELVETCRADAFRGDLKEAGIGTGRYGFRFALPDSLFDGHRHVVRVVHRATDWDVSGSPMPLDPNALCLHLIDSAIAILRA